MSRSHLATVAAIALAAYALCDLVHEVLGHGVAAMLIPGVGVVSLSSVALQTTGDSRLLAAAGSIANLVAGAIALGVFRRLGRFGPGAFFLWLFGALNLMNGAGYPLYSAVLGSGDWAVVVQGWEPAWGWRVALGVIGAAAYGSVVLASAIELASAVRRRALARAEVPRLVFTSYVAGGLLLLLASVFNPITPVLILTSGLASGFASMAGLTLVPGLVEKATAPVDGGPTVAKSVGWVVAGLAIGALFVGVVGPGISLQR